MEFVVCKGKFVHPLENIQNIIIFSLMQNIAGKILDQLLYDMLRDLNQLPNPNELG